MCTRNLRTQPHQCKYTQAHNYRTINSWLRFPLVREDEEIGYIHTQRRTRQKPLYTHLPRRHALLYLSKEKEKCLAKPEPLEHEEVVHSRHGQHRHPLLLPQHTGRCAPQAPQHPHPRLDTTTTTAPGLEGRAGVPTKSTVFRITEKR